MTDRPIIFSGPMVRALLDGRKTQTRRLATSPLRRCEVGDRLYVREAWALISVCTHNDPNTLAMVDRGFYRCDNSTVEGEIERWTPSIHMPRWASRLTLTVTGVRLQRLQEISEVDAVAEGIQRSLLTGRFVPGNCDYPEWAFHELWNQVYGAGAWEVNPWVWCATFKRII
jgi:hypothetical protein